MSYQKLEFKDLIGYTLVSAYVSENKSEFHMVTDNGRHFVMNHSQDCCESVLVEDIVGDLAAIIGSPILLAGEVVSTNLDPQDAPAMETYKDESFTWTFYKLATIKGYVDIRWLGSSNGYYSETVDFVEIKS